jgi:hypothetical protein
MNHAADGRKPLRGLVGDHSGGATPDPIPNSAVKPAAPMILPQRESRSSPTYGPRQPKADGVFLFAPADDACCVRRPYGINDCVPDRVVRAISQRDRQHQFFLAAIESLCDLSSEDRQPPVTCSRSSDCEALHWQHVLQHHRILTGGPLRKLRRGPGSGRRHRPGDRSSPRLRLRHHGRRRRPQGHRGTQRQGV